MLCYHATVLPSLLMEQDVQAITVRLPRDLYERLRRRAFDDRTSQAAIVTEAVKEKLDRLDRQEGA